MSFIYVTLATVGGVWVELVTPRLLPAICSLQTLSVSFVQSEHGNMAAQVSHAMVVGHSMGILGSQCFIMFLRLINRLLRVPANISEL